MPRRSCPAAEPGTHLIDAHAEASIPSFSRDPTSFMDRQYNGVEIAPNNAPPFEQALFVRTTVVSVNQPGLGRGSRRLEGLRDRVRCASRPPGSAICRRQISIHGRRARRPSSFRREAPNSSLDRLVEFVPPHCDPTVNLFNRFHCVRGEDLVDIWPIEARGY